jgi:glucokinase
MYIGIDLGGTNIAIGIVDDDAKIIVKGSTPTYNERSYQEIVKDMADLSKELIEKAGLKIEDIKGIGVGSPGSVDAKNGVVVYANNLQFNNVPLREELNKYFDVPVAIENDANAAALGEYKATGVKSECFVAVTLGTGVGSGIVIDGKIFRGFNGAGGELGHTTLVADGVLCTCGRKGCWEAYASVTALIRQTKVAIEQHPESLMNEIVKKNGGEVSGRTAFDAAKQGDKAAQNVVDTYVKYVADGVTNVINTFQPEILVIGGGISREGEYLVEPVRKHCKEFSYTKGGLPETKIQAATLLNDAGIVGAAFAAKDLLA